MMEKLASVTLPTPHLRLKHCRQGVMLYDIRDEYTVNSPEAEPYNGLCKEFPISLQRAEKALDSLEFGHDYRLFGRCE